MGTFQIVTIVLERRFDSWKISFGLLQGVVGAVHVVVFVRYMSVILTMILIKWAFQKIRGG